MQQLVKGLLLFLSAIGFVSLASAQLDIVDKIDIQAIQSMQYYRDGDVFRAKATVMFTNGSDRDVKLDRGDFLVAIGSGADPHQPPVHLGRGDVDDLIIPANGRASYTLDLLVGRDGSDSINRMIRIFNLIGNPSHKPIMHLKGECGFGAKMARGWASSNSVSIEFIFTPRLQNEVLFE